MEEFKNALSGLVIALICCLLTVSLFTLDIPLRWTLTGEVIQMDEMTNLFRDIIIAAIPFIICLIISYTILKKMGLGAQQSETEN